MQLVIFKAKRPRTPLFLVTNRISISYPDSCFGYHSCVDGLPFSYSCYWVTTVASERRISRILATETALSGLLAHAKLLHELQLLVASILPTPLRNHVRVVNVHNGTLILNADSPVWATELRFRSNEILNSLIKKDPPCNLVGLGLRTRPPEPTEIEPLPPRPELSEAGASALTGIAECIDTPELRDALLRLASRARR